MRRLVVCNIMSLDGYYEGPGGNVMDLFEYRFKTYPDAQPMSCCSGEGCSINPRDTGPIWQMTPGHQRWNEGYRVSSTLWTRS